MDVDILLPSTPFYTLIFPLFFTLYISTLFPSSLHSPPTNTNTHFFCCLPTRPTAIIVPAGVFSLFFNTLSRDSNPVRKHLGFFRSLHLSSCDSTKLDGIQIEFHCCGWACCCIMQHHGEAR